MSLLLHLPTGSKSQALPIFCQIHLSHMIEQIFNLGPKASNRKHLSNKNKKIIKNLSHQYIQFVTSFSLLFFREKKVFTFFKPLNFYNFCNIKNWFFTCAPVGFTKRSCKMEKQGDRSQPEGKTSCYISPLLE